MFSERLKEFRNSLYINKREFAHKLEMSESYYNMIENGKRNPSKKFISKLVKLSSKSEEYWIYGISCDEYNSNKENFKMITKVLDQLLELNLINNADDLFNRNYQKGTLEELLITAVKVDIKSFVQNKKA